MARYRYPRDGNGFTKDQNGRIITGATIVCYLTTTTTPANIYAASAGGVAVTSITSSTTDGSFVFWVDDAMYPSTQFFDITITKTGYKSVTSSTVAIIAGQTIAVPGTTVVGDVALWGDTVGNTLTDSGIKITTDGTLAANSNVLIPTEQAVKTYADAKVSNAAYGAGWSGVTTIAPAKDALYTQINSMPQSLATAAQIKAGSPANLSVGTDQLVAALFAAQGNIPYANTAGTIAALAGGAANLKLFMNAGGTVPEWAAGLKVTQDTTHNVATTGNQTLAGAGFTPSAAIIWAQLDDGRAQCIGITNGTINALIGQAIVYSAGPEPSTSKVVLLYADTGKLCAATMTFNSDGGVLAWTTSGTPTGNSAYLTVLWIR